MSAGVAFAEACRWLVLLALLAAATGKSLHPGRFRDSLEHGFPSIGRSGASLAAGAILAGEGAAGLLMLAGGELSRIGLMLALVLFVSLTLVVASVLATGGTVRCNCFGAGEQRLSGFDLARNLLFIAAAAAGLLGPSATGAAGGAGGLPLPVAVATVAVAAMLLLLSLHLRDIAQLMQVRAEDL
ncbi:MAG: hypothetical protein KF800_01345 [Lysobacter sp.]|nr:hypothetical protein [Lysobacter sp.]